MDDEQFLLSLLQFVALVAPALALLMQVIQNRDASDDAFKLLEGAFTLIIIGGLLILIRLLQQLEDFVTFIGTLMISGSLIFIAVAIWWRLIPLSLQFSLERESIEDIGNLIKKSFLSGLITMVPIALSFVSYFVFDRYLVQAVNLGPIRNIELLTPSELAIVILILLTVKIFIEMVDLSLVPYNKFTEAFSETAGISFAYLMLYFILVAPVFLLFSWGFILFGDPLNIRSDSIIFAVPYVWALLMLIACLAISYEPDDEE